jgi:hypothetical protein
MPEKMRMAVAERNARRLFFGAPGRRPFVPGRSRQMKSTTRRRIAAAAGVVLGLGVAPAAHAAFSPRLSVSVDPPTSGRPAALGVEIGQDAGDEAVRSLRLSLPGFAVGPGVLSWPACSGDAEASGNCPADSRIGSASSTTTFGDFSGGVFYGGLSGERPRVIVFLKNSLVLLVADQKLVGTLEPIAGGQELAFDDLPGATATRFDLRLDAPGKALVAAPTRCGSYDLLARFTSHSGGTGEASSRVSIGGCPGAKPAITRAGLTPRSMTAGHATTLAFTLSDRALVRVLVRRSGKRTVRTVRRMTGHAGLNRVTGLGRGLATGRYILTLKAANGVGTATRVLSLKVTARPA